MNSSQAFSLIELLVAISIIALLSGFALSAYTATQRSSRNTQRQSDLRTIQNALEHYNADQSFYPTQPLPAAGLPITNLTGRPAPVPVPATKTYLNTIPKDPVDSSNYDYKTLPVGPPDCTNSPTSICSNYCLYAKLENQASPNIPVVCPPAAAFYNFAITGP